MKKKTILTAAMMLLAPTAGFSQEVSGQVTAGGQYVDSNGSSKFNEYRDIRQEPYLYGFGFQTESGKGFFLDAKGSNLGRDDQNIRLDGGRYGNWGAFFEWDEIIHNLSNKARTPYVSQGGLLVVPTTVQGITKSLTPTAAQQQANDLLTEDYLANNLRPIKLSNDRRKGTAGFNFSLLDNLKLRLTVSDEERDGNKVSYGPIGDRPPRILNIQLAEPIDYRTKEAKLEADYTGKGYQANLTYLISKFDNNIDTLTWQNIYTDTAAGTSEAWDRPVGTFGRRALPQDNLYQNISLALGVDLPLNSRLTATAAYGLAEQDETLIPYSTNGTLDAVAEGDGLAWNDPAKLPRKSAKAEVETKMFNLDYSINPIQRLNLRAFYRYYDLANNTPTSEWRYVTGDTLSTPDGEVEYLNERRNLTYEYDKQDYGVDANYTLPIWATTLGLGYQREEIDRQYREADTNENIYKLSLRSRPAKWLNFRTKYQYGDRKADDYNGEAGRSTYWYLPAEANNNTDSQFTFENVPDTRRFDVSDRERNLFEVQVTVSPLETLDVSGTYRYRKDDFNSNVLSSQPLLNYAGALAITPADRTAATPGQQVGLLKDERNFYGVDVSYTPNQRVRFGAFASKEEANTLQRGFEFDDANKATPTNVAPSATTVGGWDNAAGLWTANIKDTTYTVGADVRVAVIPKKLNFNTSYTYSAGKVEIDYAGWGSQFADTTPFAFRTPPTVRNDRHTFNASVDYELIKDLTAALGYMYEYYKTQDWQQSNNSPWTQPVNGNEFFTRDSSASSQWGNRLPNLGSYLAPSYDAHVVSLSMTYKF